MNCPGCLSLSIYLKITINNKKETLKFLGIMGTSLPGHEFCVYKKSLIEHPSTHDVTMINKPESTLLTAGGRITCKRCQAQSSRTKLQCSNPALSGKRVCKWHGGLSTGPKTATGIERIRQAQLKHGERTKEAIEENRRMSAKLLYLRDIGDHIGMFYGGHTRGRKPTGYVKLNMNDPDQLRYALLQILK